MDPDFFAPLEPNLALLREEHVLVQAWKKTASYIRYHNWFSDTLALDWETINLQSFLAEISERLESPESWENKPLRIVPAPKSQDWATIKSSWEPSDNSPDVSSRLRPLAHVGLHDQVAATVLMLGLANRVETKQGDSRKDIKDEENRKCVISYGNRLFCDEDDGQLFHRWGSKKLYRSYYQDYRQFVSRPEAVAWAINNGRRVFIMHLDLSKFYDRVRPELLATAIEHLQEDRDDDAFFTFAKRLLCWNWDPKDAEDIKKYAQQSDIEDFSRIALPQGLVASGFLANVVLLPFDNGLRRKIGRIIKSKIRLDDVCRYVDDFRVVVSTNDPQIDPNDVESKVLEWLTSQIKAVDPSLHFHKEKKEIFEFGSHQKVLVRHSTKMRRIQSAVSGGFDAVGGLEILDNIQGLTKKAERLESSDESSPFALVADVRDATVLRFAAGRFRTTYRSLRPLLEEKTMVPASSDSSDDESFPPRTRSRAELDEDAKAFAFDLIGRWTKDPSHVRLLRIGLDLWPDPEVLRKVLKLLEPLVADSQQPRGKRQVAWYCLSELFRAGATETGMVEDEQSLPDGIDLKEYRRILSQEARRVAKMPEQETPWYLHQQALLFLAVHRPKSTTGLPMRHRIETARYHKLLAYLNGSSDHMNSSDFATLAVLARYSFLSAPQAIKLVQKSKTTRSRKIQIARHSPSFMRELGNKIGDDYFKELPKYIQEDICANVGTSSGGLRSLADMVLNEPPQEAVRLRNELSLLHFGAKFLAELKRKPVKSRAITPCHVWLELDKDPQCAKIEKLQIKLSSGRPTNSQYRPPNWAAREDYWRFHLGFLLRFILSRQPDFTRQIKPPHWKEKTAAYHPAISHWYQRRYGLFSGQPAFGDNWVPITEWFEYFLTALLAWPGCKIKQRPNRARYDSLMVQNEIKERINKLREKRESSAGTLLMPMRMNWPDPKPKDAQLRVAVVQTVIPNADNFNDRDLTLSEPEIRRQHRNHLSAALAAVQRMLALRATHVEGSERLDWLILPELAVHPDDVKTHLIPYARANKTLILAGLAYERLFPNNQELVNSALWVIPEHSMDGGWQTRTRRQCKLNLAPDEQNISPKLTGFRPCQWLLGYPWADDKEEIWLTASVCYDATDLALATKLRNESDVFAIPSLNKDVETFDRMALALHYHMFQLVIVANNGAYGGSNAYMPVHSHHERQVFHLHGQPQASVAFLEIKIADFMKRGKNSPSEKWKNPPAGWKG